MALVRSPGGRLLLSLALSTIASVLGTYLLRAAMTPAKPADSDRPPRPGNVSPTTVFVVVPVYMFNSGNLFARPFRRRPRLGLRRRR